MKILGCEVPVSTLEAWAQIFVFEREPFFLTLEVRALLSNARPCAELKPSLELADAYLTYQIPKQAEFVASLKPEEFRVLPRAIQVELVKLQIQLGRGQVYDLGFVCDVLGEIPASLERDVFAEHFTLRYDVWNAFSTEIRYRWLEAYVSLERLHCLSSTVPENTWGALPEQVRSLAGTFSSSSGANCFATVIAGLTTDLLESKSTAQTWMLEHGFLTALEAQGFHDAGKLEIPVKPNSILTWWNSSGKITHACLTLEFDLVLNKDAQSWFAPRQILRLNDVLESWFEDAVEVRVWTRDSV